MKFAIQREILLKILQKIVGAVEKKQTQPILSNVLLVVSSKQLTVTATDLEIEWIATVKTLEIIREGSITLAARKLIDIFRNLTEGCIATLEVEASQATIKAGKSRFTLITLPAEKFPRIEVSPAELNWMLSPKAFSYLLESTYFSSAQNDVRYYMNGLLLQILSGEMRAVATDGHRLALAKTKVSEAELAPYQAILPRKGSLELLRLLNDELEDNKLVKCSVDNKLFRVTTENFIFTSKLIEGRFPDYNRVIPVSSNKTLLIDRDLLKNALTRIAILSSDKFRPVRLQLSPKFLVIMSNNQESEEAVEEIEVDYAGEVLEIGFNVSYLLDGLNHFPAGLVKLGFTDGNSSMIMLPPNDDSRKYVVMPMKL